MTIKWWHDSVIYQIYPRSFQDSNGDGIGDIQGIVSRLDYLKKLGINLIWLSPVYDSPNYDNGYDISDYRSIMAEFGTMEDMELLISEAKQRDIGILMDLVLNHTSIEHNWFLESQKSRDNSYRDFYIWRDGVEGNPPNDMKSIFGGSAWEYDDQTDQYYLHLFSKEQPDLNWENKKVRTKLINMINFWIDKGIAGFRLDVIDLIGKQPDLGIVGNGEHLEKYIKELSEKSFGKKNLFSVAEAGSADLNKAKFYSNPDGSAFSTAFQFHHFALDEIKGKGKWYLHPLSVSKLKEHFSLWQTGLDKEGWNSLFWNNHDSPRIVSRWGDDQKYRVKSAKMLAILLHLMKGTPFIYQGEEIGMTNYPFGNDMTDIRDIESINIYDELKSEGWSHSSIMTSINVKSRDNSRTPMQWTSEAYGGFTSAEYNPPWISVNPNYREINVEQSLEDHNSIFYTYQNLIQLRKNNEIVVYGKFELINTDPEIFAYYRILGDKKWIIICNFSNTDNEFDLKDPLNNKIISNREGLRLTPGKNYLEPYDAIVYSLK